MMVLFIKNVSNAGYATKESPLILSFNYLMNITAQVGSDGLVDAP